MDDFLELQSINPYQIKDPFASDVIEQIKEDSFYGGIEIGLGDVQHRLNHTYKVIGSPTEIEHFVKSGLTKYGCKLEETRDQVWAIQLSDEFTSDTELTKSLEGMTFASHVAFEDPSLEVIDPLLKYTSTLPLIYSLPRLAV